MEEVKKLNNDLENKSISQEDFVSRIQSITAKFAQ